MCIRVDLQYLVNVYLSLLGLNPHTVMPGCGSGSPKMKSPIQIWNLEKWPGCWLHESYNMYWTQDRCIYILWHWHFRSGSFIVGCGYSPVRGIISANQLGNRPQQTPARGFNHFTSFHSQSLSLTPSLPHSLTLLPSLFLPLSLFRYLFFVHSIHIFTSKTLYIYSNVCTYCKSTIEYRGKLF